MLKILFKHLLLLSVGGAIYSLIELLWRGYTYPSMFFVGGLCFVLIGLINELLPWDMALSLQIGIAAVLVTLVELVAGCVLNLWMGLGIWDYSGLPLNLWGQICVGYTGLWFLLALPAIVLDDWLRYRIFGEEKPRYFLIKKG